MAGSYVNCPECGGRFWAPVSSEEKPADSARGPVATPPGEKADRNEKSAPAASPDAKTEKPTHKRKEEGKPRRAKRAEPSSTSPRRNVARFVSAEAAESPLELAEDGKLPELQLKRDEEKSTGKDKDRGMNPAILVGGLALSVVASLVLLLWEPASSGPSDAKAEARQVIRDNYFATIGDEPLAPYQELLRQADRAASRGDHRKERKLYQKVLDQLRAERGRFDPGLTGSQTHDKELEEQIIIILRE
jgi:hypothetical protein